MAQSNSSPRGGAIAVAVAGLTLAAGVSLGALVGWVRPPDVEAPPTVASAAAGAVELAPDTMSSSRSPSTDPPTPVEALPAEQLEPEQLAAGRRHHDDHERGEHHAGRARRSHEERSDDD
jgi:hypothetical protein